ncbi:MAG: hypothetical protein H0X25_01075 [Acidobacteriales bacterium]|nr:hypothetical protein [Terriglobales bacterium]
MQNNPEARLSIVAYRPKPGKEADLLALTREHVPYLQSIGLATRRPSIISQASDGTIVEVFEWAVGGLEKAHADSGVAEMWKRYAAACDIVSLNSLKESGDMFANFVPLD